MTTTARRRFVAATLTSEAPVADPLDENDDDYGPFVCPGCYAFCGEPHAYYCLDASIERQREEEELGDIYDHEDEYDDDYE